MSEISVRFMDKTDIFWQMIKAGWGEVSQEKIPENWRDVPGPDPWPSKPMQNAEERKQRRKRLTTEERIARNERIMRHRQTQKVKSREKRKQARIERFGKEVDLSEMQKALWKERNYGKRKASS